MKRAMGEEKANLNQGKADSGKRYWTKEERVSGRGRLQIQLK